MDNYRDIEGSKGCFKADTLISTPEGLKKIRKIKTGDIVYAFDKMGNVSKSTVVETFRHDTRFTEDKFITIEHEKGTISPSDNHWILTIFNDFKEAGEFEVGEYLTLEDGKTSRILSIEKDKDERYSYNLTTNPHNTYIANSVRVHNKGGGKGGERYPEEDDNTLFSKANARVIDLICEGEIEGLVDGPASVYFDEVPLYSGGQYNFKGVTLYERVGTPDQSYIPGFPSSESETLVRARITNAAPITKQISDTSVDNVRVTFTLPALFLVEDDGDVRKSSISLSIYVKDIGGSYFLEKTISKYGKCTSAYQFSYKIQDMSRYGSGPWTIKVERNTADSDSTKKQNDTYWESFTEIIDRKLSYPDSALVAFQIDARQFGEHIPRRAYEVKGMKIKIPSNYEPVGRFYTGQWDGTFKTDWSNNPAWVYYDILTNGRYGLGVSESMVDKWTLYTIGAYCDVFVSSGYGIGTEPRFAFNGVISNRAEAVHVVSMIASTFRAMPFWATGQAMIDQDRPKDPVKIVTAANVIDGEFIKEGTPKKGRHTAVNVSWNDPNDFYRLTVESVVDTPENINRYGWQPVDVIAYGCTTRGQAYRFGKWFLETEQNQTELLKYKASFDHADVMPGDIIKVLQPHYTLTNHGGRIVSAASSSVVVDREIEIEGGETYTLTITPPTSGVPVDKTITNSPGTTDTLTISTPFDDIPIPESIWIISSTSVVPKQYRILSNTEVEPNIFEIVSVFHDPDKYARVEDGFEFDPPPYTTVPTSGSIEPPTNVTAEEYTYDEGENHLFGVMISWTHTRDVRMVEYDVQSKVTSGSWEQLGDTASNSWDMKNVSGGIWNFRVRSKGFGAPSAWVTSGEILIHADPDPCPDITGLKVVNGPDNNTFDGKNCEIEWDPIALQIYGSTPTTAASGFVPSGAQAQDKIITKFKDYKISVSLQDDTPLRDYYTTNTNYVYDYEMNQEDNAGTADRSLKFSLWSRDVYDKLSQTATTLLADNPAPTMAGSTPTVTDIFTGLKIDWSNITPADNDLLKYRVYLSKSSPPGTLIAEVGANTTNWIEAGLDSLDTYYAQIEPWDVFGVGVKSNVNDGEPLKIQFESIETELFERLVITDSLSTPASGLEKLYDDTTDSDGIAYTSGDWIQYRFPLEQLQDRIAVWFSGNCNCYISYSNDGTDWNYLKAEADHTLDANGRLLSASTSGDAATNYWTANEGDGNINVALYPNGLTAQWVRLHILSSVSVYELVFVDQVIAEQIVANNLSAISADLGIVVTGLIQSTDYPSTGLSIDVDTGSIIGAVTFTTGSTGYNNISDAPKGDLAYLDTVGANDCNTTIISGGKVITGLLTANNIQTGTLNTGNVVISSTDGKSTMDGNTLIVKDAANNIRVKLGKLS